MHEIRMKLSEIVCPKSSNWVNPPPRPAYTIFLAGIRIAAGVLARGALTLRNQKSLGASPPQEPAATPLEVTTASSKNDPRRSPATRKPTSLAIEGACIM